MSGENSHYHKIDQSAAFQPGWHEIRARVSHDVHDISCSLEFGDGLPNYDNIDLEKTKRGYVSALIYLDFSPAALMFESRSKRSFDLSAISLEKCSKLKIYRKIARKGWHRFAENPIGNTPRLIRSFISLFSSHNYQQIRTQHVSKGGAYSRWISKYETPYETAEALTRTLIQHPDRPKITLLMPVYDVALDLITQTLRSIQDQTYSGWEVSLCFDGGAPDNVKAHVKKIVKGDARFTLSEHAVNKGISEATNTAYGKSSGAWVGMIDHDDVLPKHALAEMATAICNNPEANLIYSDEDKISEDGQRFDPHFKCEFSPELILAMNYINHFTVIRSSAVKAAGLWRKEFDGAQDYDLVLRITAMSRPDQIIHIPKILYHWRASENSEAKSRGTKAYANGAGLRAVESFLNQKGESFTIKQHPSSGYNQVKFKLTQAEKITIIIPTRDRKKLLQKCISSILEKTTYHNYEILIIDNGSQERVTLNYFESLKTRPNIRILKYDHPFNYAKINNFATKHTDNNILCFLNNDIEVLTPSWLQEMLSWLQRPDVGAVGAKLLYPDKTVQHAGIIMGIGAVAGHSHKYYPRKALGYFARLVTAQNFSAVTGACLMVRKSGFLDVGGFDGDNLPISYNDVDLCLKLCEIGRRIVWTPDAELIHYESASRGKLQNQDKVRSWSKEVKFMRQKWRDIIDSDPYYSPNLSRQTEDFSIKS